MDNKGAGFLGLCLIIAALIVTLVPRLPVPAPQPIAPRASAPTPSGPQVGRFQMGGVPGHAYVLDTATGEVWEQFVTANEGSTSGGFGEAKIKIK